MPSAARSASMRAPVGPPLVKTAVAGTPSRTAARATLIPPPPGSYRGREHRIFSVAARIGTELWMSSAGFIVTVTMCGVVGEFISSPWCPAKYVGRQMLLALMSPTRGGVQWR